MCVDEGMFKERRETLQKPFFSLVKGIISHWALTEVTKLKDEIKGELEPYTNMYTPISGLPCKHTILRRLNDTNNPRIRPEDFHRH